MAYNIHCAMSGRNCSQPIARLRNARVSGHSVAHLPCGLGDLLCLWPEHDVLARISKCRCAKRECKHDACASDRPAAQATWSAYCFHGLIVMRLWISCKLIYRRFRTKSRYFRPPCSLRSIRPEEMLQAKIGKTRFCFFAPATSRCSEFLIDRSSRFPLRIFLQ
jgi:hypothetical protein